jgi:hypothetical protein
MIKKIAIFFAFALLAIGVNAQLPVGGWAIHSPFNGVSTITEIGNNLYYLSSGSLFSYDKDTQEVRALNIANDLNGGSISNIYTEPSGAYIIVVYSDNNMDRINANGSVVNIPDIHDALITGTPTINHVGFGNGRFYVATSFGLVTFNATKNEVIDTMFSPNAVQRVYGLGDYVVIFYDNILRKAKQSERLVSIDQFSLIGDNTSEWTPGTISATVGDHLIMFQHKSGNNSRIIVANINFVDDTVSYDQRMATSSTSKIVTMGANAACTTNETKIYTYNADGFQSELTFPSTLKGYAMSALNGMGEVWAGNSSGISKYDLSDISNPKQLISPFGAVDFASTGCNNIVAQPSGNIYFWNATDYCGDLNRGFSGRGNLALTRCNTAGTFTPITTDITVAQPCWVVEDPHNQEIVYVSTFWSPGGIYRFKDGNKDLQFTNANSALRYEYFYGIAFMCFDRYDNFWVIQENAKTNANNIQVIPYSKLSEASANNPNKDAWKTLTIADGDRATLGCALKKSDMMIFCKGRWNMGITFIHQNNTASIDDDTIIRATTYIDQDNKTLSFNHIGAIAEDHRGRLWVGTNNGVFEITDPTAVTSDVVTVNHLKVPRNDGTGLADYLLDALTVSCIAVDNSNRKWLSTTTDGVYLVSEDGDEILEHYTTSNSILPSDCVYSVACDPNSSSVFFATASGVVEYNSTSAPASDNLDNVYAFPNPVRPDYSGWITVTGLMDNTLVKITDAAGNLVYQGRSEGGIITWDGCNFNGERVKTGVYFVFASNGTSSDSSSESCVTKIMVIN